MTRPAERILRIVLSRRQALQTAFALTASHSGWANAAAVAVAVAERADAPSAIDVRRFSVRGDGSADDTAAIQRALDELAPGQTLVFPAGSYRHSSRLVVRRMGVALVGEGATLHATNPADQALLIQASGVRVRGFTMSAVTDRRRDAPWESRIAVWRDGEDLAPIEAIDIRDNRLIAVGAPGSALANSSSSAAIFIHNTRGFTVQGNVVQRSLSDAIHITGGSSQGRVVGNLVRESGDDMIAVVSYLGRGDRAEPAARVAGDLARRRRSQLVRDVLIADNDVAGQYWGRGISVVGGEDISIIGNSIDQTTHAAGVYIAREAGYSTFGVRNVRISGNRITRVQTTSPAYTVLPVLQRGRRTGHAAIEIVAQLYDDEAQLADMRSALAIRSVAVEDNVIEGVGSAAIRIGDGWRQRRFDGRRPYTSADVGPVSVRGNRIRDVRDGALQIFNRDDASLQLDCANNTLEGAPVSDPSCAVHRLQITGSSQRR